MTDIYAYRSSRDCILQDGVLPRTEPTTWFCSSPILRAFGTFCFGPKRTSKQTRGIATKRSHHVADVIPPGLQRV
jgi:hypothetical protein